MASPRAGLVLVLAIAGACSWTAPVSRTTPPPTQESSKIYAADGTLITTLHAEENRETVPLSQMPKALPEATVAIEDERFWHHRGVDVRGVARAVKEDATKGRVAEGGSTITQQYVKTVLLDPRKTLHRKVQEAALAYQLERHTSKKRILELYLNTVYFGNGAYGAQAASATYFGTAVGKLNLAQSALLAGLIRAPASYDPYDNAADATARRNVVLDKMAALGAIPRAQAEAAKSEPLGVVRQEAGGRYPAAYFVEEVKQQFLADPKFGGGSTPGARRAALFSGGLRITTTIDLQKQAQAEDAVAKTLSQPDADPEAALVSLEPQTGYVRALVGGRDFFGGGAQAKFDLATQGRRQAGSSFKPFVLAAALLQGIPLNRMYPAPPEIDIPLTRGSWHVKNYEGEPSGSMDLVDATVHSINTVYAQLVMQVGPQQAISLAKRMGVASPLAPYPSAVLGTNDVSPLDMAAGYIPFANRGVATDPVFITKVTRADGTVAFESQPSHHRAVPVEVVDQELPVLQQVVERGTGVDAKIGRPVAGKTGTSEEWRDAWFVGFTPDLVTSVWVGFPDRQRSMVPPATRVRVVGGSWPADIWQLYMSAALSQVPVTPFPLPGAGDPNALDTGLTKPVPNVVGMPVGVADDRLAQEGFRLVRVDVPNNDYPPGYVVGQDPCAGCFGRSASPVTVQVSNGQRLVAVPSVVGLSEAGARQALETAGLRTNAVQQQEPPTADSADRVSLVWKQSPSGDANAVVGSTVTVWVNPSTPPPTPPPPTPTTQPPPPPGAQQPATSPTTAVSPPPPPPPRS